MDGKPFLGLPRLVFQPFKNHIPWRIPEKTIRNVPLRSMRLSNDIMNMVLRPRELHG